MERFSWPAANLPRLIVAGRFPLADRNFAVRYYGRMHTVHLHGYAASMRLAGRDIQIRPGDITISPAHRASSYDLPRPGRHWCVHFDQADHSGEMLSLPLHVPLGKAAPAAEEQFAHICRLMSSSHPRDLVRASLCLQELLLWIDEQRDDRLDRMPVSERASVLIDQRFEELLTVAEVARAVGASQAYLARSFRARFGVTLLHRLLQRRIAHARYLLESTDLPIWLVAERVGIPDPQHFNKCVRRRLGSSPSAIRAGSLMSPVDPDR